MLGAISLISDEVCGLNKSSAVPARDMSCFACEFLDVFLMPLPDLSDLVY